MATKKNAASKWTGQHARWADVRIFQIAGELLVTGDGSGYLIAREIAEGDIRTTEKDFRLLLRSYTKLAPTEIEREVRRVRARADGHEVVTTKTTWEVKTTAGRAVFGEDEGEARRFATRASGRTVVKVTRRRTTRAPKGG